LQVNN